MKKISLLPYLLTFSVILIHIDCKKETGSNGGSTVIPPPVPPSNTAPKASAGEDLLVFSPTNFCVLDGFTFDEENNIKSMRWTKISGPASFLIEFPESLSTKLSNLERGVYKFELAVTDAGGLVNKDTNTVIVGELPPSPEEKIFSNLSWSCGPWDCGLQITNVYNYIPSERLFKVFIKRDGGTSWTEVMHWSSSNNDYDYSFYRRNLWIYYWGIDVNDSPDIKIVY